MDLELRHLRYFVAVAEELHFGRAAARLHMAQPPLSQAIRRLEDEIGCALLERTSRSVALTPAGTAFLERARRTLRNVADDVHEARSIGLGDTGLLNVGFVGSGMLTTLPAILSRYVAEHPRVQLQLHESFTSRVVDGLLAGDVDAGIVRDAEPVDGLVATPILTEPFVAVVPGGSGVGAGAGRGGGVGVGSGVGGDSAPRGGSGVGGGSAPRGGSGVGGEPISVAALEGLPFVYPPRGAGARAFEKPLSLCEEHGFRPQIAHEASHWVTILRLVGAGLGVTIAPACVRAIATPDVRVLALEPSPIVSELAIAHRAGDTRAIVRDFVATATVR